MDKRILTLELTPKQIKIKEALNNDFLPITIRAISDINPNRNDSHFVLSGMEKAVNLGNFYNRPILANFIPEKDDFGGHDGQIKYDPELDELYEDFTNPNCETPIGSIRESDRVEIVYDAKQKVHWIEFDAIIWTRYSYKQVKKILKSRTGKTKISVEVEVLDSIVRDDGVEDILEFNYLGTTLLGDDLITGIQDAELTTPISTILTALDSAFFQNKRKALEFAYNAYDKSKQLSDVNKKTCSSNEDNDATDINENPSEEISMDNQKSQKGGKYEMNLTMNEKRELLESYIIANYPHNDKEWIYVCDLDDTHVYFNVYGEDDVYYKAPYVISEDEEGHAVATVDFEAKVRIVRSWKEYSAEDDGTEEGNEDNKVEKEACTPNSECKMEGENECKMSNNSEDNTDSSEGDKSNNSTKCSKMEGETGVCPDCGESPCVCENKSCNSADKETEIAKCGKDDNNNSDSGEDSNDDSGNGDGNSDDGEDNKKETESAKCSNGGCVDTEGCTKETAESFAAIDLNQEPSPINTDNASLEAIITDATNSIAAPPVQVETDNGNGTATMTTPKGPNGETPAKPQNDEGNAVLKQPNDQNKDINFSANSDGVVEINGEKYTFAQLQEKFTELQSKVDKFEEDKVAKDIENLITFGTNFINNDSNVDAETKAQFVAQVEEKCKAFELKSEDEVTTFAKSMLAMYYYENADKIGKTVNNSNNEGTDVFSVDIVKEQAQLNVEVKDTKRTMKESADALRASMDKDIIANAYD